FTAKLAPILDDMGCELVNVGYHPKSRIDELPLIPKERYKYMEAHFKTTGTKGKNMMKGSAASHVSLDYENEADFKRKFRVANILGPLLSFICDNTPVFEGEPFAGRMARTHIWNDVDPARSMVVRDALDSDFGFREYAKYIYDLPPVLLIEGDKTTFTGTRLVSEIFADRKMTNEDMTHVSSMAFPDVRLKSHVEIRMADSMPIGQALAYVALLKGIFYDSTNLDRLYEMTIDVKNSHVTEAKAALMKHGQEAQVYGRRAMDWITELFHMAENSLSPDEKEYLMPLKEIKEKKI
ncbi:MAG: glutamate-cysteine ligase family protein, partial [Defluviitaleaceae bacterium]|nr:glutamate-cysteine ligase family protein [Defluviitaleaceae bacterium]